MAAIFELRITALGRFSPVRAQFPVSTLCRRPRQAAFGPVVNGAVWERLDGHDSFVDRHAMVHEVLPRGNEVLQRRVNIKKLDVRDEAVDARVDARRGCAVHVSVGWYKVGEDAEIGEAPCISSVRLIPADPLKMITLKIEFARDHRLEAVKAK
jgi:hypothetical protein